MLGGAFAVQVALQVHGSPAASIFGSPDSRIPGPPVTVVASGQIKGVGQVYREVYLPAHNSAFQLLTTTCSECSTQAQQVSLMLTSET